MYREKIEEFDNLMQAGLDEVASGESQAAEEYFSDAAYVLRQIDNDDLFNDLQNKYEVNPLDFEV